MIEQALAVALQMYGAHRCLCPSGTSRRSQAAFCILRDDPACRFRLRSHLRMIVPSWSRTRIWMKSSRRALAFDMVTDFLMHGVLPVDYEGKARSSGIEDNRMSIRTIAHARIPSTAMMVAA